MRKVIHKLFWIWNFDKEEKWLNEMAEKGLALTSVGFCRYEFEDCTPGEYKICMEFYDNKLNKAGKEKYIELLKETGVEPIRISPKWGYYRKRATQDNFELFSNNTSRIKYLTKIIRYTAFILVGELIIGCNILLANSDEVIPNNMYLPFYLISAGILLFTALGAIGLIRLFQKRKKLKSEQQIFE